MFRKTKPVVGLDIGSSAVKVVELRRSGQSLKVVGFGMEPVPSDTIVDGAIIDAAAVADAVARALVASRIKTKDVVASLSGNAVIVKKINLPVMTEAELSESIHWEAEQYIPFDIQDVNLDYQILSTRPGDGKGSMEVLLVAAKKDRIADYTDVIHKTGRTPVVVDVDAFAVQNAYEANYDVEPGAVVALLNIGASGVNINIVSGDQSLFTRDISMGGNAFTEAIQKELGLPFDSAERVKKGEPMDGVDPADVAPILRTVTENLLLEIQKTFDFFKATAASDRIDRVLVSGGDVACRRFRRSAGGALRDAGGAVRPVPEDPIRREALRDRARGGRGSDLGCRRGARAQTGGRPMIRINLLAIERDRAKRRSSAAASGPQVTQQRITLACSLILVLTALGVGWWYWSLKVQSDRIEADIVTSQKETARLRTLIQQVQTNDARRAQLQERVGLIEELRKGREGAVRMLDEISRSLPDMLWLTEVKQQGADLTISGRCMSLTALSDFVDNLKLGGLLQAGRDPGQPGRGHAAGRRERADPVLDQGDVRDTGLVAAKRERRDVAGTLTKLPWYGQVGAFLGLSAAGVAVFFYFYVSPMQREMTQRQRKLDALQLDIRKSQAIAQRLPQFRAEVADLEMRLETLKNVLPEEKDMGDLLRRLQTLAVQSNLTIRGFKPVETPVAKQLHAEWPINLAARRRVPQPRRSSSTGWASSRASSTSAGS